MIELAIVATMVVVMFMLFFVFVAVVVARAWKRWTKMEAEFDESWERMRDDRETFGKIRRTSGRIV